ncbi:hypothetical protein [Tautonia sociabilis]|uniref:Secreted protein n=1 Tax=Tautonia sociabilis TaxID=2080755 RepID=A0A432MJZ8_9BACT|nr:hypothetical protein [Tautonia sociabilis]RUL87446.1 hypothetical protein TsocGM_12250 [Tautonia sociabilis]
MNPRLLAPLTASALVWALSAGCSPSEPAGPTASTGAELPNDVFAAEVELTPEQIEAINQLPPADAKVALAQKVCPDSGEPLGGMGVPIKVDVNGIPVFVCCAGCKDGVLADPDAALAKVPQGSASPTEPEAPAPEGEAEAEGS